MSDCITCNDRRYVGGFLPAPCPDCHTDRDSLRSELTAAKEENGRLAVALQKVSDIRDSIVGQQGFNFSEHAYPLVAVLDAAGFKGAGYEIARKSLGTLIEQRDAAEKGSDSLRARVAELEKERDSAVSSARAFARAADTEKADRVAFRAERDALATKLAAAEAEGDAARSLTAERTAELHLLKLNTVDLAADLHAAEERLAGVLDGTFSVGDGTAQREIERLSAAVARMAAVVVAFRDALSNAKRAMSRRGQGGQQVSFHGDFANATPSVLGQIAWWVRELETANRNAGEGDL